MPETVFTTKVDEPLKRGARFAISRIMLPPPLAAGMVLLSGILLVVVRIKKSS